MLERGERCEQLRQTRIGRIIVKDPKRCGEALPQIDPPRRRKKRASSSLFAGPRPSFGVMLLRHVSGTATEKLALLTRLRDAGRLQDQDKDELQIVEATLVALSEAELKQANYFGENAGALNFEHDGTLAVASNEQQQLTERGVPPAGKHGNEK
jgi:hypothetical protein